MARPGPWSVKGVDESTREIARAAAQRAGLPIGVWLDRAILKVTESQIVPETDEAASALLPEAGATEAITAAVTEPQPVTAAAPDQPIEAGPVAAPVEPPNAKPARPVASLLDIPPPSEERVDSAVVSAPPRRRSGYVRYGIAAMVVLVLIGIGVTYIDDLNVGSPSTPTAQVSTPDRAPPAAATETAKATPPAAAPEAGTPKANVAQAGPGTEQHEAAVPDAVLKGLATRAANGDVQAEYELALRYSAGRGVPKNDQLAAEWFEKAAVHGLAPAQYNLGVLFERGQGVAKDPKKAFFWYQSAAQQNYARAEHNLATMYATGNGVAQNYEEAATWFRRAADAGIGESLYSLGLMYEHGLGVPRDIAMARTYYQRAADAGSADARSKLLELRNMSPPETASAMTVAARRAAMVAPSAGGQHMSGAGSKRPLDRAGTAELQRLLARLDFAPGAPDGVAGRRTAAAIKLYQEFAGLPVDGKATVALLNDVRDVSKTIGHTPLRGRKSP